MINEVLFTLLLVFLNAFFVAAEFAIVKVRASQLELKAKSGSRMVGRAQHIIQNLDAYLAATQLGITLASLGLGWVGESLVAEMIIRLFSATHIPFDAQLIHKIAFPVAFIVITVLHIVLGELAPKSLAIRRTESTAILVALPLQIFYTVFRPFIWALNGMANLLLRLLGLPRVQGQSIHTAEELILLLEKGRETGEIESSEHELIKNVFEFNERTVRQIMVPRTQIFGIEMNVPNKEIVDIVIKERYSRIPVYKETIDNIVGVVYAKDLLTIVEQQEAFVFKDIIRPAYFVPRTKKISDLLKEFQRQHIHIAIVLDEFGGTSGLITLEDIIEELVGEIQDEYDEEAPFVTESSEGVYIVNAHANISDANEHLPLPLPESKEYNTVAGLVNVAFGRIPDVNETASYGGYEITIAKKSKRSVQAIQLRPVSAS